jgi:hypothetical protein
VDVFFDLISGFLGGRVIAWFEPSSRFSAKGASRRVALFRDRKHLKIPIRMTSHPVGPGKVRCTTVQIAIDGGQPLRTIAKGWWDAAEYGPFEEVVAEGAVTPASEPELERVVLRLTPASAGRARVPELIETDWAILQAAAREAGSAAPKCLPVDFRAACCRARL